jgi:hypothetical protein
MSEITGRLENWVPQFNILWGHVHDDVRKRFEDGTWIHTSSIFNVNLKDLKEGDVVQTLNSSYLLGKRGKIDKS